MKSYLPELSALNAKDIHTPWEVPPADLMMKGIHLGKNYPYPICDLQKSREKALKIYHGLKEENNQEKAS